MNIYNLLAYLIWIYVGPNLYKRVYFTAIHLVNKLSHRKSFIICIWNKATLKRASSIYWFTVLAHNSANEYLLKHFRVKTKVSEICRAVGKKNWLSKLEFPFSFDNLCDILSKIMTLVLSQRKFYRFHNATFYLGFKILVEEKQSNDVLQILSILYNQVLNVVALVTLILCKEPKLILFQINSISGNIIPHSWKWIPF